MKKIQFIFILCVLSFLASCNKDDDAVQINHAVVIEDTQWIREKVVSDTQTKTYQISFFKEGKGTLLIKTITKKDSSSASTQQKEDFTYKMTNDHRIYVTFKDKSIETPNSYSLEKDTLFEMSVTFKGSSSDVKVNTYTKVKSTKNILF